MKELEERVIKVIRKYSDKEFVNEKIVLLYSINTVCSYCKLKSGEIVPNGSWQERSEGDYNWIIGTVEHDATHSAPFGFNIFVKPRKVKTWKFPDGSEFKDYITLDSDDIENNSILDWLSSVCSMGDEEHIENLKEIEYSEEVGLFFKNALLYICRLNEKLKLLFGEQIALNNFGEDIKKLEFLK